jgi:ankyrin repeat protein
MLRDNKTLTNYVHTFLCVLNIYTLQLDRTALHWAAANGHTTSMDILLKAGADVDGRDKVSYTCYHNTF